MIEQLRGAHSRKFFVKTSCNEEEMIALPFEPRRLYSDLSHHIKGGNKRHLLFEFPEKRTSFER